MKTSEIKNPRLLYLSRGRGFSHAMNDLLIIKELKDMNKRLSILVASYDKGYTYFSENGFEPFNLGLKQNDELTLKSALRIWSLIRRFKPDLVVTDEVFIALHITKGLRIPSILITHWFFESFNKKHPMIPAVKKANYVIFVDTPEFHTIPFDFNVHITFVGPVIREFEYTLKDKKKARDELGIDNKDKVILVTPGGRYRDRNKLLELSTEVFKELDDDNIKLILLTGELYKDYSEKFKNENRIIVKDYDWNMDRLMVASDIAICKGTFSTTWELAYLGIPSISVPDLDNPIDQIHVNKMDKYNITLRMDPRKLNKSTLLRKVKELINSEEKRKKMSKAAKKLVDGRGQKEAAEEINYFICNRIK
jgi:uncharacterized protein (TIGR00661 family)